MAGEMGGGRWRQTSRRETAKEKKERVRVGGKKKKDLGEQGRTLGEGQKGTKVWNVRSKGRQQERGG